MRAENSMNKTESKPLKYRIRHPFSMKNTAQVILFYIIIVKRRN
jgi:hypothetical protein